MGQYARIISHDQLLANLPTPPKIINDMGLDLDTEEGRNTLASYLSTSFDGDNISPLPSCLFGHLTGEENVGRMCPICNTRVTNIVDRPVDTSLWIAPPKGVKTLFNPEAWTILSDATRYNKKFCVLDWICDPMYNEKWRELDRLQNAYANAGHQRGLNYFYDHFDAVIQFLFDQKFVKGNKQKKMVLAEFIRQNRDKMFSSHLPVPSSLFLVTEKTPMGTYADEKTEEVVNAIYSITSTLGNSLGMTQRRRESYAVKAIRELAKTYQTIYTKFVGGKYGLVRKQLIGSRLHMTARAVITSLSGVHQYNELHIPWAIGVQLFMYHLTSKLMRAPYYMTPNEAMGFLMDHTLRYNEVLDKLFQELIAESFTPLGVPCMLQRNPSLTRQSAQALQISKVKTDVTDNTFSVSVLILKGFNADFDGDELNLMLFLDKRMWQAFSRLQPHLSARDLKRPRKLSGFMEIPAPMAANWAHYVHEHD